MGLFKNKEKTEQEEAEEEEEEESLEEEPERECNFQTGYSIEDKNYFCNISDCDGLVPCEGIHKCPFWNRE